MASQVPCAASVWLRRHVASHRCCVTRARGSIRGWRSVLPSNGLTPASTSKARPLRSVTERSSKSAGGGRTRFGSRKERGSVVGRRFAPRNGGRSEGRDWSGGDLVSSHVVSSAVLRRCVSLGVRVWWDEGLRRCLLCGYLCLADFSRFHGMVARFSRVIAASRVDP